MTTNAGDKVKFWRNKRPLTLRDFQEGVVIALGPKEIKPAEGEDGLTVTLAAGEFWLSVRNAANGKDFRVVAKECGPTPEPGCFTVEKPAVVAPAAPAEAPAPTPVEIPGRSSRSSRVTTES